MYINETVDTVTFSKQVEDMNLEFTVKKEFLSQFKDGENVENTSTEDLFAKFMILKYFHNPNGPAIRELSTNHIEYWIDGKLLSEEEAARIENKLHIQNDVKAIVNE